VRLVSRGGGSAEGFHRNWDQVFVWDMGGEGEFVVGYCGYWLGSSTVAMKPKQSGRAGFRIS